MDRQKSFNLKINSPLDELEINFTEWIPINFSFNLTIYLCVQKFLSFW